MVRSSFPLVAFACVASQLFVGTASYLSADPGYVPGGYASKYGGGHPSPYGYGGPRGDYDGDKEPYSGFLPAFVSPHKNFQTFPLKYGNEYESGDNYEGPPRKKSDYPRNPGGYYEPEYPAYNPSYVPGPYYVPDYEPNYYQPEFKPIYKPHYEPEYRPSYGQNYEPGYRPSYGQAYEPEYRPSYRPNYGQGYRPMY